MNLKKKFVVGAASVALIAGMGIAPAVALDPSPSYNITKLRLSGADRGATSIAVGGHQAKAENRGYGKTGKAETVYIAGWTSPADSASAGSLTDGPILLAKSDGSNVDALVAAVKDYNVDSITVIGGENAVPQAVVDKILAGVYELKAVRLAGADRYETSVAVAKRWSELNNMYTPSQVILANGDTLVDALTAGTLDWPILLLNNDGSIPDSVKAYLSTVKPLNFTAVGGKAVVPDATVLMAQYYTDLSADMIDTDDDLASLKSKRTEWELRIANLDAAIERAELTATTAKLGYENRNNLFNNAVNQLNKGIKYATTSTPQGLGMDPFTAKTLTESTGTSVVVDGTTTTLGNLLDKVEAQMQELVGPTTPAINLNDKDVLGKYFNIRTSAAPLTEKIYADFVKDASAKGVKAFDAWNTKGVSNLPTGEDISQAVVNENVSDLLPANNTGATKPSQAVKEVAEHAATVVKNSAASAKSTLAALNQKIATLTDKLSGKSYHRLAGKDRYETSAAISAEMLNLRNGQRTASQTIKDIYLVNGNAFADATVAGVLRNGPVLLVPDKDTLPASISNEIKRLAKWGCDNRTTAEVYGIGGTAVVSNELLSAANDTAVIAYRGCGIVVQPQLALSAIPDPQSGNLTSTGSETKDFNVTLDGVTVAPAALTIDKVTGPDGNSSKGDGTITNHAKVDFAGGKIKVSEADGAKTLPGQYTVNFTADGRKGSMTFTVAKDVIAAGLANNASILAQGASGELTVKVKATAAPLANGTLSAKVTVKSKANGSSIVAANPNDIAWATADGASKDMAAKAQTGTVAAGDVVTVTVTVTPGAADTAYLDASTATFEVTAA